MFRRDFMPRSHDAALEQRERRLHGVCVDVAANILVSAVFNGFVLRIRRGAPEIVNYPVNFPDSWELRQGDWFVSPLYRRPCNARRQTSSRDRTGCSRYARGFARNGGRHASEIRSSAV